MEDSPLSITASIAGILTFVAAIAAFIYVRYQTLIHSEEEINAIKNSVASGIVDLSRMVYLGSNSAGPRETDLAATFKKELFLNELDILLRIYYMMGYDLRDLVTNQSPFSLLLQTIEPHATGSSSFFSENEEFYRDVIGRVLALITRRRAQLAPDSMVMVLQRLVLALDVSFVMPLYFMQHLLAIQRLSIGTSMLWRWYMGRDEVLKLIEKRDAFRSR
ncbi:hypothetical protein CIB48_g926 [Xylaria polymorpha]|nr:hypothetical protein CIB48_g926 [Xylaria polymorpha]